jgi:hypothetical protein
VSRRKEINGWRCKECGAVTYAVHVDDGVTPMFLACRASGSVEEGCHGQGVSLMYPVPPAPAHVVEAVGWEWYQPTGRELRNLDANMRDHVERGGLMLRPLTDDGRGLLEARGVPDPGDGGVAHDLPDDKAARAAPRRERQPPVKAPPPPPRKQRRDAARRHRR